jgi:hypothetical protein
MTDALATLFEIPLNKGLVSIVDREDFYQLLQSNYQWQSKKHGRTYYAYRKVKIARNRWTVQKMHNAIMGPGPGMEVDHINGNGLDNRRENLRVVTHQVNCQNQHIKKSSRHLGVGWHKGSGKWRAYIRLKGRTRHIGLFQSEAEAATVYRVACAVLLGDSRND